MARPSTSEQPAATVLRESRWGGPKAALLALLLLGAALRLVGVRYGLPLPVLNPDEESIVPRAWKMAHGGGLDPHWFDYPTLLMYLLAPFQAWQAHPSYLAARLIVAGLGVGGIGASWWLGRRAYGLVAGSVAAACVAVETTHVLYSHMAVTDVPLTLGVAAALALMVSDRVELAGLAAGVAMGVKYPALLLVAPLVVASWRRWWRLAASLVLVVAGFAVTSPFVFLHPGQAAGDALRVQRRAHEGWLGFEHDHIAPVAFVDRLWHGLGPALVVAAAGLAVALVRRTAADRILLAFVVVYFLDLITIGAHFDRYVLPLLPALGALAGRLRAIVPATLLLLVVPLTWSIRQDERLTRTDTRLGALAWMERKLPPFADVAVDPSAPRPPAFRIVALDLPGPGRPFDERRNLRRLRDDGVTYVVVTGSVTDRVRAARDRYPREVAFYRDLDRNALRAYYAAPGNGRSGPWVAVYELGRIP